MEGPFCAQAIDLEVADVAAGAVVVFVVSGGEDFQCGLGFLFGSVCGLVSFGEDFVSSVSKFDEGFAA